ncbi:hypothetical protein DPQ33_14975 [Oceanidesulfovibrio indonesiensis]|uniref:Translocation and assembly module TamB C-terminal domain-containing protein n=1 Tax=Oceanidesulfovibrio indonesiensis TaxID=54767 RepID=A0A7M3MBE5_9BACT|nr:translocation/assembly module TamB domain-containing protein [Oceanidesulfovibrio indonesiensis]TVM15505.1 hypothetical protein DPQ33_14975 [Oceanidesulfovibrio indonesiensis]
MASRRVRIMLKALLAAVVLVILLLGGVFLAVQTGPVKRAIAAYASKAAGDDMHLTIEGLSGLLPLSIQIDRVAIAQSKDAEPWLVARGLVLEWSLWELLFGTIHVNQVGAEDVMLADLPPASDEPEPKEPEPVWPPPSLSLPGVQVDRLWVGRFDMGEAVLGQAAAYIVLGNARLGGGMADVDLEITRIDGPESALKAMINTRGVDTAHPELEVDITLHEPPGGLLATATDMPQTSPLNLALKGQGPLSGWSGALSLMHGKEPIAMLDLSFGATEESLSFGMEGGIFTRELAGSGDAPGLLGCVLSDQECGAVRELGERFDLALDGRALMDEDGEVRGLELARIDLTAESLGVEAAGRIGRSLDDVELDVLAHIEDLSFVNALVGQSFHGALVLSAALAAHDEALQGHIDLSLESFAYEEYRAANATLALTLDPLDGGGWAFGGDDDPLPPVRADLVVDVNGLAVPPGMQAAVAAVGDSPRITGSFRTLDSRTVRIERLGLGAIAAVLNLSGQVSLDGPAEARLELTAADLENATRALGITDAGLHGSMTLTVDGDGDWSDPSGRVAFDVRTEGLVVDAPGVTEGALPSGALGPVLGSDPRFSGEAVLDPSGALRVNDLSATAQAFSLAGSAQAHLQDSQAPLSVDLDLTAESLEPFSALAGVELGGALHATVQGNGDMDAPDMGLNLTIDRPRLAEQTFDRLGVEVSGSGPLESWSGKAAVTLAATVDGQSAVLDVDAQFALGQEQVSLPSLTIRGPGVSLDGDVTMHSTTGLVTGTLEGGAEDLNKLGAFAGMDLAGALQTRIVLKEEDGGQALDLTASLSDVQAPGAAVGNAQIMAQLSNLTATPRGTAQVEATGIATDGFEADTLILNAVGGEAGMDITLNVDGSIAAGPEPAPLELILGGRLQPPGEKPLTFRLTELAGSLNDLPLSLERPGAVTVDGGDLAIDPLEIGWGQARLAMQGGWDASRADLSLSISELTADSVMLLTGNEPVGPETVLSLDLGVTGSKASPTGTVTASVQGVRLHVEEDSPLSAMDAFTLNVEARVGDGSLEAAATTEGMRDSQVRVEASLPATFSLEPFAFELPSDGPLSGALLADAKLESFESILAFYGVQVSGQFDADFTLSGTLSAPKADGKATISNGRIEYVETGTVITGLDLEFVAAQSTESDSPRLIVNLTAGDGEKGSVQMSGWIDVDPQRSTPFRINVALARFTAVRMDVLRFAATGDAALEGNMDESRIVGGISLDPVQVWLPDTLPPDVVEVEVVDVRTLKVVPEGETGGKEIIRESGEPVPSDEDTSEPAPFDPTLELGVEVREGMRVQGLGVDTTWKGRLDVSGRLTEPRLTGNVEITEGDIEFLGKRFNIRKGVLNFWGQSPPSPRVEVEATTDAGDVMAIVRVYGQANSPQFSLASEPSRPRDEVLSYILFGRDLNRISPVQAVKIAQTAAMLASGSDFLSIQRTASKIPLLGGLDIGLADTAGGGAVEVGAEVIKDVHVSVAEGLGESSTQVEVEVDLTKQFSVRGTVDDKGDQSVGFDWRLDY